MSIPPVVTSILVVLCLSCSRYDVEALCEDLEAECNLGVDYADCVTDGRAMEEQACDAGCEDELDAYLECLAIGPCRWETRCQADRTRLIRCAGDFPSL